MDGEEIYRWFEKQVQVEFGEGLEFSYEPTVTPGVYLGKIARTGVTGKPLVKTDIRPEGLRLHFPLSWQQELSDWLGIPPAPEYRLKSNWVNQPSIGVAIENFDPYFKDLAAKVVTLLRQELA